MKDLFHFVDRSLPGITGWGLSRLAKVTPDHASETTRTAALRDIGLDQRRA